MAEGTKIEWTHRPGTIPATMNALVGCQKVSQGCTNCYAIEVAHVRAGNPLPVMQEKFAGTTRVEGGKRVWTGKVTLSEKALLDPIRRKTPRTYFVNALSDLFYERVPDAWIDHHFAVFALCPQHTFIVLTKRPKRQFEYFNSAAYANVQLKACDIVAEFLETSNDTRWIQKVERMPVAITFGPEGIKVRTEFPWPLPNVWLGVSVEDQATADERIPLLLNTPAAVRFISAEPLLGPVSVKRWMYPMHWHWDSKYRTPELAKAAGAYAELKPQGLVLASSHFLDWAICGGESGPGARPMHPDWARGLRDQCVAAGVPFFFKQWGEWARWGPRYPAGDVSYMDSRDGGLHSTCLGAGASSQPMVRVGKKAAGHLLDGKQWHQFPEEAQR